MRLIEAVERLNMSGEIGDGMVATLHELAGLARLEMAKLADGFEVATDDNVAQALGSRICCTGYHCGCRGSTVGEYLAWQVRETLGLPRGC